jgi:hypothetical protein
VHGAANEVRDEGQTAKQRRSEDNACEDLADDFGLAKFDEDVAQELGKANQQQKYEEN